MDFPGAHNVRRRPQGLGVARDVSAPRIGDLASPTEHRMPLQNDGGHHPGRNAERHLRVRSRAAGMLGVWQRSRRSGIRRVNLELRTGVTAAFHGPVLGVGSSPHDLPTRT